MAAIGYKRPDDEQIIQALRASSGLVALAASKLGVNRRTLYNWFQEDPELLEALHDVRESMKDLAEGKLLQQVQEGNLTAIIYYLKTQARDRGYQEHSPNEAEGRDMRPFILEICPDTEPTDGG